MKDHKADQDPEIWFVQKFRVETLGFDEKWASSSTSRYIAWIIIRTIFLKEKVMFGSNNNSLRTSGGPMRSLSKKATQKIDILL